MQARRDVYKRQVLPTMATQEGGVGKSTAGRVELGHEGVAAWSAVTVAAIEARVEGARRGREVAGLGPTRHVSAGRPVHCNAVTSVIAVSYTHLDVYKRQH